jgi:hypothetical protein
MSPIAAALDIVLAVLLVSALGLGVRLERRLKALRDGQAHFTGAVAELDRAAQRAEKGLADLRTATEEATDTLSGRIEKARALAARLETLTADAARPVGRAPVEAARPPAARAAAPQASELLLRRAERPAALRPRASPDDELFESAPAASPRAALGGRR